MLGQLKERNNAVLECIHVDLHGKAVSNGLCYLDSATVKLQVMLLFFALCSPVLECNSIPFLFCGENAILYSIVKAIYLIITTSGFVYLTFLIFHGVQS